MLFEFILISLYLHNINCYQSVSENKLYSTVCPEWIQGSLWQRRSRVLIIKQLGKVPVLKYMYAWKCWEVWRTDWQLWHWVLDWSFRLLMLKAFTDNTVAPSAVPQVINKLSDDHNLPVVGHHGWGETGKVRMRPCVSSLASDPLASDSPLMADCVHIVSVGI